MTSGKMSQIKIHIKKNLLILLFLSTAPVLAVESEIAPKSELSELLTQFAQIKQSTVDFTEEKHAFFLEQPVLSSGQLQFIAPDKLSKFILKPEKITQQVHADVLKITSQGETQTINLNEYPEFSIILRSIISLLSGDHDALKRDFKINFEDNLTSWTLLLSPHDSYVSGHVDSIKMLGKKNKLMKIIITEPNNDRSVTSIYNHR
ncbi:MAG: outer membrane lipoprotein carrier protein LolA [Gammaproteobacteria bacterium]|nr:outer membrane lipoprotein carrier protein LolA [Gammaproteobacteria bacterium]MCW9031692.1 outer membrane lipoprotein carrier protein LolA [Gammaproteobacteria bacterium]